MPDATPSAPTAEMLAQLCKRLASNVGDYRLMASQGRATQCEVIEASDEFCGAIDRLAALARSDPPPPVDEVASLRAERDDYRARLATQCGETLAARGMTVIFKPVARVIAEDEHETVDVGFVDWIGRVALKPGTQLYVKERGESGKC